MSTEIIIELNPKSKSRSNGIIFDIRGSIEEGLDKSIINALRRTLLSSIPTVAFRTTIEDSDLVIKKNDSPLHNEFISDRIGLIPLYINPFEYEKQFLFHLDVKNNNIEPTTTITAKDFDIYPLKKNIDRSSNDKTNFDNYDKDNKLSEKEKIKMFKPYKYKGEYHYCIITELKSTNSDIGQSLEIYGVPSISYAYEDAKWQAVSCATYSYKKDEQLFQKVLEEKIKINEIPKSQQKAYEKELAISESERYFHRDKNLQPYYYTFTIDSVHYLNSKDLFILANQIIIESLEKMIDEFPKLTSGEKSILSLNEINEGIFQITIHGADDTLGNIIQSYISQHMINDTSILSVCGYKKEHPLNDILTFTISLNTKNKTYQLNKPQQVFAFVEIFIECCNKLIQTFSTIKDKAVENL